jgi:hypothetical protein
MGHYKKHKIAIQNLSPYYWKIQKLKLIFYSYQRHFGFNQALFIQFMEQKNYLNDSFTAYKKQNRIND